ncbi:MAG: DinB family protein [Ardenticatenaceae bacterium]|nr:DinB family protein [Ardenticatenaceae bacterium]
MGITQTEIEEVLHMLAETPERITAVAQTLSPTQLQIKPDAEAWSVNEILAHLRACVDVWSKDIDAMLTQDSPTLRYLSPRTYMRKTNYATLEFAPSFQIFCVQREALLKKLHTLTLAEWARDAEIKGRRNTVFSHVRRMARHESGHCDQIESL